MFEDRLLDRIAIEQELAKLHPADAEMILLLYKIRRPADYTAPWPPKITDVGAYIGIKYEGRPMSEAAMRYRHKVLKQYWKKLRGGLRRKS